MFAQNETFLSVVGWYLLFYVVFMTEHRRVVKRGKWKIEFLFCGLMEMERKMWK
jgi:hypothetical protein